MFNFGEEIKKCLSSTLARKCGQKTETKTWRKTGNKIHKPENLNRVSFAYLLTALTLANYGLFLLELSLHGGQVIHMHKDCTSLPL